MSALARAALANVLELFAEDRARPEDPPAFKPGAPWPPRGWLTVDEAIRKGRVKPGRNRSKQRR